MTFGPDRPAGQVDPAFTIVHDIIERHWGPEAATRSEWPQTPLEVITYVRSGRLLRTDPEDEDRVLRAGDFEREIVAPGSLCVEANPSDTHFAHVFRVSLRLQRPDPRADRQREHFSEAQRKDRTLLVASQDGTNGSLRIASDVRIYSAMLYPGRRVVHEVQPKRAVWVHAVHGALSLGPDVLRKGDGVGVTAGTVSMTAREHSEILLVDVAR